MILALHDDSDAAAAAAAAAANLALVDVRP